MVAPLVLIVGRISPKADGLRSPVFAIGQQYMRAIRRAGGIPLMLPPDPGVVEQIDSLLPRVDAVVFAGGGDIDPRRYGQAPAAEELYGIVTDHDEVEFAAAAGALGRDLPVLAVCRGMQLVNVALGGTLHQHIGDDHWYVHHDVLIEPGSRVAKAVGEERIGECHSVHHQAVDRLGRGLRTSGQSADGITEAYESDGRSWLVGVQWHPEDNAHELGWQQALYDDLVRHA
ncbi:MAG: peptidase [Ilumatobacteraceae bacterium]|jgi:putative glutamine amidotransferase|nr:peptidase [Ilumatobacteraceae bacterium]